MSREEFDEKIDLIMEESGVEIDESRALVADSIQYISLIGGIEENFNVTLPDYFLAYSSVSNVDEFLAELYTFVNE